MTQPLSMGPMRVLIVDDEEELVSALEERLNLRGFQAHGVTTGAEALAHLAGNPCDVVLLDVKMPGLGGLEMIGRIKEIRAKTRIILLTGRSSAEDAQEGLKLGAFEYLTKPVQIERLIEVLHQAGADGGRDQGATPG